MQPNIISLNTRYGGRRGSRMRWALTGGCLLMVMILGACKKYATYPVSFGVTTAKATVKVGDTVLFAITGNPGFITFYSGETGTNYQNANRSTLAGTPTLEFNTYKPNGTLPNSLSVLLSTNYDGIGTIQDVSRGSWTDITGKVTLSTGTDNTYSGVVNLEDAILGSAKNADSPLYVAFKYDVPAMTGQPQWILRSFFVRNTLNGFVNQVSGVTDAGWFSVAFQNSPVMWAALTTAPSITPNNTTYLATTTWLLTRPLYVYRITRDLGVGIKTLSDAVLTQYTYVYKKAGTYTAVFKASNTTIDAADTLVRQVTITVQ